MSKATTTPLSLAAIGVLVVASVCAQKLATQRSGDSSAPAPQITPQATSQPVVGGGTTGRLAKWAGSTATTSTIADSNISEDKFGNLGLVECSLSNSTTAASISPNSDSDRGKQRI